MPQAAMIRVPDPSDQIWTIINAVLGGLSLSSDAADKLDKLILTGINKIKFDRLDEALALEAQENYRLLAETLRKNVQGVKSVIDVQDIEDALKAICPLYPIC